jgi:hypothetical protein
MAHFALVDSTNTVIRVAAFSNEEALSGQNYINTLYYSPSGVWIQTSYNTRGNVHYSPISANVPDGGVALRGNYAGIGYTYDPANNVFYSWQPYPSWVLDNTTWLWKAPVPYPNNGITYTWNESTTTWDAITGMSGFSGDPSKP